MRSENRNRNLSNHLDLDSEINAIDENEVIAFCAKNRLLRQLLANGSTTTAGFEVSTQFYHQEIHTNGFDNDDNDTDLEDPSDIDLIEYFYDFYEQDEEAVDIDEVDQYDLYAEVDDDLGRYLKEIAKTPLLTAQEEEILAKTIELGEEAKEQLMRDPNNHKDYELEILRQEGEAARALLVKANTKLVVSIAKKYMNFGANFQDLIQEGNVGLLKAVDKFEYRRGNRFSTYATFWIRQGITRSLPELSRTINVPVNFHNDLVFLYRTSRRIERLTGNSPSLDDLAAELYKHKYKAQHKKNPTTEEVANNLSEYKIKVNQIFQRSRDAISLNKPLADGEIEFGEFIQDESEGTDPEEDANIQLSKELINAALDILTERERNVIQLRFGLNGETPLLLEEIGEIYGVSRERIRQIEAKALNRLRISRHKKNLRSLLD